jgi:predicted small lipoprotein YifL
MSDQTPVSQPRLISSMMTRRVLKQCFGVLLVLPLFGCGVKGPLTRPQSESTGTSQQFSASSSVINRA